jgi:mannose-1-phosphate guanylyltransferase
MVAEQVRQTSIEQVEIILEPFGRDTAPAIALAALNTLQAGEDPVLLVLPADHDIRDIDAFLAAVKEGEQQCEAGNMVTFGVVPAHPETGYGYIKAGADIEGYRGWKVLSGRPFCREARPVDGTDLYR